MSDEPVVMDLKKHSRAEVAKVDHIHLPSGFCFKRRAGALCGSVAG